MTFKEFLKVKLDESDLQVTSRESGKMASFKRFGSNLLSFLKRPVPKSDLIS
jgi:hypothetical protein